MKVSAAAYNRLLDRVGRIWPVHFFYRRGGAALPAHPWAPQPGFDEEGRFGIRLVPGLVNGVPAHVKIPYGRASSLAQKRIERERGSQPEDDEIVRVSLDEGPFIAPAWRPVDPNDPTRILPPGMTAGGFKNIYATEVLVTTNRTASFGLATYRDVGSGVVEAEVNVAYRTVANPSFEVQCVENFQPLPYVFSPADVFFNRYQEPAAFQIKLATIYGAVPKEDSQVLSPAWDIQAAPDVYFNLAFHDRAIPPAAAATPIRFFTPLGLGLSNTAAAAYLASVNEATAAVLDFFAPRRTGGMFHAL